LANGEKRFTTGYPKKLRGIGWIKAKNCRLKNFWLQIRKKGLAKNWGKKKAPKKKHGANYYGDLIGRPEKLGLVKFWDTGLEGKFMV